MKSTMISPFNKTHSSLHNTCTYYYIFFQIEYSHCFNYIIHADSTADSKMLDSASQNPLPNIVEDVDENGDDDVQVIDGTYVEVNPLQKKERKRKAPIWKGFTIVTLKDGTKKGQCNFVELDWLQVMRQLSITDT